MAPLKLEGIVLKGTDFSETSRIVTLWTRDKGKMRALAKGARRLKSPFENSLDLLNRCQFQIIHKSSGALDLLTESRVLDAFAGLRNHLPNLYAAYHVADLLQEGTQDLDPHPELYDLALGTLSYLEREPLTQKTSGKLSPAAAWCLMSFEFGFLGETGYQPDFSHCSQCGQIPTPGQPRWCFSCLEGTIVCDGCLGQMGKITSPGRQGGSFRGPNRSVSQPEAQIQVAISPDALDAARRLGNRGNATDPPPERVRGEIRALFNQYLTWLRGRRPRLVGFLGS